jgi:guanylate kinase
MDRIWAKDNVVAFDVDVMGGIRLKELFGEQACSVFVMPPSVEELERRLIGRATDAPEVIAKRVAKAASEIEKAPAFDHIVINDDLQTAINQAADIVRNFIKG